MEHITVKQIVEATGGRLLCGSEEQPVKHLSMDSRTMRGDDLFVPLIGEKADAHRFIDGAFAAGAVATLTSRHDEMSDSRPWIRVNDTRQALQAIGAYYRERLFLPLVGITGSVGKTTTREMVAAALSAGKQVFKTPANYNSQVGVPVTLSDIGAKDEIGILELGMSEPGELTIIARIAQVDAAIITNIGVTHIEQLGSQENIFREKMTIQDGLKPGGILYLNGDDEWLSKAHAKPGCKTVYYGTGAGCEYRAEEIRMEQGYPVFTANCRGTKIPVRLAVMGKHNVLNAMAALAIADQYGVPLTAAAESLAQFNGFQNRQQVYHVHGITVIDDTYNASPVSMKAGLEVLCSMAGDRRKIAVLADMKELGQQAADFHQEVGKHLAEYPADILLTLGSLAKHIAAAWEATGSSKTIYCFADGEREILAVTLKEIIKEGDCVLLKGSNSMKLAEVAAALIKQTGVN